MDIIEVLGAANRFSSKQSTGIKHAATNGIILDTNDDELDFVRLVQNPEPNEIRVFLHAENRFDVVTDIGGDEFGLYKVVPDAVDGLARLNQMNIASESEEIVQNKNYDSLSETGWNTANANNHYATTIGATFNVSFFGTGFNFQHYSDSNGGLWEFDIAGAKYEVSTYNAEPANKDVEVVTGLPYGYYTVVATFQGEDPLNPVATPRGWAKFSDDDIQPKTIGVYTNSFLSTKNLMDGSSNKEFAFRLKPADTELTNYWIPTHSGVSVSSPISQKVYIDGAEVSNWSTNNQWKPVSEVLVQQIMEGYHPDDMVNPILIYTLETRFTSKGCSVRGILDFKKTTYIDTGYSVMLPALTAFGKRCVTSKGDRYTTTATDDGFIEILTASNGIAFFDPVLDYVVACTLYNFNANMRLEKNTSPHPNLIWQRVATQKFYNKAFHQETVPAGTTYLFGGDICVGVLEDADSKLPQ